jgi:hypothetical protein
MSEVVVPSDDDRSIPDKRIETQLMEERFASASVGETITYDDLESLTGIDVRGRFRHLLYSALGSVKARHRIAFACVPRKGYVRADDAQIVATVDGVHRRIRGVAKSGMKTLACAEYSALSPEDQRRHNTGATIYHVVSTVTSSRAFISNQTPETKTAHGP